ncbi:MAG: response regulator [Proteobacteria bacterium]|nr:response regulator [Pseudomonadota bacterium]MBU1639125.1 response regulator [Pseudomonadota bacterium]
MRALIIEDNENNMELISFILESNGYQTIKTDTGRQGYELALAERPDFILLDIQLPDIMGTEVLTMIRESAIGSTIPIIAVTSYAMAGDRERLLAAGCDGYIEKPIDPMLFIDQINRVLGEPQ